MKSPRTAIRGLEQQPKVILVMESIAGLIMNLFDLYPIWGFVVRWSIVLCGWVIALAFAYRLARK
nr:MAG TPA: hypothetical protein [Caudoviricetes sp.]